MHLSQLLQRWSLACLSKSSADTDCGLPAVARGRLASFSSPEPASRFMSPPRVGLARGRLASFSSPGSASRFMSPPRVGPGNNKRNCLNIRAPTIYDTRHLHRRDLLQGYRPIVLPARDLALEGSRQLAAYADKTPQAATGKRLGRPRC